MTKPQLKPADPMILDLNTRFNRDDLVLTLQRAVLKTGLITKPQLSKMHPWTADGRVEAQERRSSGKKVFLLRSYQNVTEAMNRWEDRPGYWKRTHYEGFVTDVWYPYQERKRPGKLYEDEHIVNQVQHNLGVTDSYVAFYPHLLDNGSPVMTEWEVGDKSPYHEAVRPDAVLTLFGVEFCDEEECGHHPILSEDRYNRSNEKSQKKSFNYKISRYLNFFSKHPDKRLLIRVQKWLGRKYDANGTDQLFDQIMDYLATVGHKDKILVAKHRDVSGDPEHTPGEIHHDDLGDPLGAVWYQPGSIEPISIQEALRLSHP